MTVANVLFPEIPTIDSFDRQVLRDSIATHGLDPGYEPIVDENGDIIDGRNRWEICQELGIECTPRVVEGLTDVEKWDYAFRHNAARRHLSPSDRRLLIKEHLRRHPELSNRAVARDAGVDDKTVAPIRRELEQNAEIPRVRNLGQLTEANEPQQSAADHKQEIGCRIIIDYPAPVEEVRGRAHLPYVREKVRKEWTGSSEDVKRWRMILTVKQWTNDLESRMICREIAETLYRRMREVPPVTMDRERMGWR